MKLRKIFMVGLFVVLSISTVAICACKNNNKVKETGTYNCEIQPKGQAEYCKIEVLDANYCRINYLCSENGNSTIDIVKRYKKDGKDNKFQFFKSDSGDKVCLILDNSNSLWGQYKKGKTITVYGKNYNKEN